MIIQLDSVISDMNGFISFCDTRRETRFIKPILTILFITLSVATTLDQSGPGSNGNERVLHISQISKVTASPSDGLMPYPGHSLKEEAYTSAEMQSEYSTAPDDRTQKNETKFFM